MINICIHVSKVRALHCWELWVIYTRLFPTIPTQQGSRIHYTIRKKGILILSLQISEKLVHT